MLCLTDPTTKLKKMKQKQKNILRYYSNDEVAVNNFLNTADFFDFNQFDSLKKFTGQHPLVMKKRIEAKNWNVELDVSQKKFTLKGKILFWLEKKDRLLWHYRKQ